MDIFDEIRKGNYIPFLKFLRRYKDDESIDFYKKDNKGFNAFHYIVTFGNYRLVRLISENFPNFLSEKTLNDQTNLMLSLNQKNLDIISFLLQRDKNVDLKDKSGFNVFFYLIKNNSIGLFIYMLNYYLSNEEKILIEDIKNNSNTLIKILF